MSSLDSAARVAALLVCVGTASGPMPPFDPMLLAMKGSLFVTRPALADYIADPAEKAALAGELFDHVGAGRIGIEIHQTLCPRGCRAGAPRPGVAPHHRFVDFRRSEETAMRVEPLTCHIGAELSRRQPGRRRRATTACSPRSGRAAAATQGAVPARPGHHPAPSTWPSPAALASWRTTRWSAATRSIPAWCASTSRPRQPAGALRERLPLRRHLARRAADGLRAALRGSPPVGGDTIWVNMARGLRRLPGRHQGPHRAACAPRHTIERTFGADYAAGEARRAGGPVPDGGAPGGAHPPGNRREGPVRQRLHHALRQLPHAGTTSATARTSRPARGNCCTT